MVEIQKLQLLYHFHSFYRTNSLSPKYQNVIKNENIKFLHIFIDTRTSYPQERNNLESQNEHAKQSSIGLVSGLVDTSNLNNYLHLTFSLLPVKML